MNTRLSPYPGAQAVSRAIAVLKAFTDTHPRLSLAEITRATRLNKATAYRLVAALEREGLIAREENGEAYRLGPEAIALGARALRASNLRGACRAELEALAQTTRETATLEVLVGREVLIVDEVISPQLVGGTPSLGTRWPAHATSTGKALLAHLPASEQNAYLRRSLSRHTPHTLTADQLRRAFRQIVADGYATVCDELEIGYSAVAAPVLNHEGHPAGALCVGGPTARLTPERLAELAPLVVQAARRASAKLGYQPPSAE